MEGLKRQRAFFSLLTFCFWAPVYAYAQILPVYTRRLGGSLAMVGLVGGAYGLTQLVLRVPIGIWSDRLGRRVPFIVSSFAAGALSNLLFLAAGTPWALFWARAMAGVSSTLWVVLTVLAAGRFPGEGTTGLMGLLMAASNLSQLAASTGGAALAGICGWKAPFVAALIVSLAGLVFSLFLKEEKPSGRRPSSPRGLLAAALGRPVLLASMLGIAVQYVYWAMGSFAPVLAADLGGGRASLAWLSLAQMAPAVAAAFAAGPMESRFGRKSALVFSFILSGLGMALAPAAGNLPQLCLFAGLTALARGVSYPLLLSLAISGAPPAQSATAMGFFQAVYAAGMFLGPAASGEIAKGAGMGPAFRAAAAVAVLGGAVSLLPLHPPARSSGSPGAPPAGR